ncbi:MAG: replication-associated recombination protein A [Alphaproteobacteria bacterium]|nr:MAG: replication-associated recombination protein A [Alphaproteobacteria bacterium]
MSLFESAGLVSEPLAARLRPQTLAEVVGQAHLVGEDGVLTRLMAAGVPQSVVFWGPPGCGKTTLARLYAQAFGADFVQISAVLAGVADVRKVVEEAKHAQSMGRRTVLFVDEIHRFTKSQQDAFLPHVEGGLLVLVGATTENPSFALNNALLSRCTVLPVNSLDTADMARILTHAEEVVGPLPLTDEARAALLGLAHGDARYFLNLVELVSALRVKTPLDVEKLKKAIPARLALYDKGGDWHYDLISALHKSVRGSDPDAAMYYVARMLAGGEDGMYLARRLIRMAVEDVGLADPQALQIAMAAQESYRTMGSPEGDLSLAEAAVYMALAPKSNALYKAFAAAKQLAAATSHVAPPKHIVNAPTKMMKELGHGKGYAYDHDTEHGFSGQNYWPEGVFEDGRRPKLYEPVARGFEREMQKRMAYFEKLRDELEDA